MKFPAFLLYLCVILCIGCQQGKNNIQDTTTETWKPLKAALFTGPNGELGFATDPAIAHIPKSQLGERCENVFITHIGTPQDTMISLQDVIDTATFISLGDGYYKDRNHIYFHYAMCESGYLVFTDDTVTTPGK